MWPTPPSSPSSYGAWVRWLRDDPAGARTMSDDAIARAARLGHPFTISLATCFDLWLRPVRRRGGRRRGPRPRRRPPTPHEQGFDFWLGWAALLRGWAVARLGAPEDGIAVMRKGLVDWQATGSRLGTSYFLTLLADGQALAGHTEQAVETARGSPRRSGSSPASTSGCRRPTGCVRSRSRRPTPTRRRPCSDVPHARAGGRVRSCSAGVPAQTLSVAAGGGHSKLGPAVRPSGLHGMRMRATAW